MRSAVPAFAVSIMMGSSPGPDFPGDVFAGHVGQPQVQHDQVGTGLAGERDRLGPGPGGDDGEPVVFEIGASRSRIFRSSDPTRRACLRGWRDAPACQGQRP